MAIRRVALAAIVAVSSVCWAQQPPVFVPESIPAEEEEEVRYYSVEIIVFENTDVASAGNEIFDPEPLQSPFATTSDLLEPDQAVPEYSDTVMQDETLVDNGEPEEFELEEIHSLTSIGFRRLETEEMSMQEIFNRLNRLDAYRPVLWGGWIQQAVDEETTLPVGLRLIGAPPIALEGVLTLYLKNYLHLAVDLTLEDVSATPVPAYRQSSPEVAEYGDAASRFGIGDGVSAPQIIRYRIEEDRIFNNGHLRYFDHPRFGALVRVFRFEEAEQDDDEALVPEAEGAVPAGS